MPFWVKTLSVTIESPDGKHSYDPLRYAPLEDGIFGKSVRSAFLIDLRTEEVDNPNWADAVLQAGHGVVKTLRGHSFPVRFRVADDAERAKALERVNEIRPLYGTRDEPDSLRIILAEMTN